jgi:hypothetical protein
MGGIAAASTIGQGIATKKSQERASESQARVDAEAKKFEDESRQMQMDRAKDQLAFDKQMFGQQQKRENIMLQAQAEDIDTAKKKREGQAKSDLLTQKRNLPVESLQSGQANILRLQGARDAKR